MKARYVFQFFVVAVLGLITNEASATSLRVRDAIFLGNPDRIIVDFVNDGTQPRGGTSKHQLLEIERSRSNGGLFA